MRTPRLSWHRCSLASSSSHALLLAEGCGTCKAPVSRPAPSVARLHPGPGQPECDAGCHGPIKSCERPEPASRILKPERPQRGSERPEIQKRGCTASRPPPPVLYQAGRPMPSNVGSLLITFTCSLVHLLSLMYEFLSLTVEKERNHCAECGQMLARVSSAS